jgi:hypothetical protein
MLDAERCVLCSRCLRFEEHVTGTNSFEFRNRGDHTQIATFEDRPITHNYAWNLADVCPVGALLSHDFRFKMRVWFLESTDSVCPGCSTGCNIHVDQRDQEVHRLRPRRNVEVNKSWMCDIGRVEYKEIAMDTRISAARVRRASAWEETSVATALDLVSEKILAAPRGSAFLATPQATNEDVFMFKRLSERAGPRAPLSIIAHSLGTVIASNYIYDLAKKRNSFLSREVRAAIGRSPLVAADTMMAIFGRPGVVVVSSVWEMVSPYRPSLVRLSSLMYQYSVPGAKSSGSVAQSRISLSVVMGCNMVTGT